MSGFSEQAWQRTDKLQAAMLELPFNAELAAGDLSRQRFQFYLAQDARYLVGFGRALAIAAARAPDIDDVAFFAGAAQEAIVVERELHAGYFASFGLDAADLAAIETSPTCLAYTSYLLALAAAGSTGELLAGLLPCFWVYHHVGQQILAGQPVVAPGEPAEHPFQAWIDTYADETFGEAVDRCKVAVDRAAAATGDADRDRMFDAFTRATEFEWLFWDSAHRMETWPTAPLRSVQPRSSAV
jgi:thiaminase/transcriptional activator TenA